MQNVGRRHNEKAIRRAARRKAVDIPDSARQIKARFWEKPERELQLKIARFARETGKWHLHPDVTYQRISRGEEVRFLELFDLEEKLGTDEDNWCPCAACPHDFPKFKLRGVVCWLPQQGTIVVVGWDCFRGHNPEEHARAAKRYYQEVEQRKAEDYLLARVPHIPALLGLMAHDLQVVEAFSAVRAIFHQALIDHQLEGLISHVRGGMLHLLQSTQQIVHGTGVRRLFHHKIEHASIKGAEFLDRKGKPLVSRLEEAIITLKALEYESDWDRQVLRMLDHDKARHAEALGAALRAWHEVRSEVDKMRQFISTISGKTLQRWSETRNNPFPFFFDYTETEIRIGLSPAQCSSISIPETAHWTLSDLPNFAYPSGKRKSNRVVARRHGDVRRN